MTDLERLNEALKVVFLRMGIYKKADMAEYLGYKSPYFSGIINGKEKMSDGFLKTISEKLHINIQWITTGEGDMTSENRVVQQNQSGDNINGHSVTVNKTETDSFIELLKKKDEQIDRLLSIIEKMNLKQ
jgi:hypothetical protein